MAVDIVESGDIILSVIIPTRNRPHLLSRAIRSVAAQNFQRFEVCIVDNNPDQHISSQVKNIVDEYAQQNPQLNWIYLHSSKSFASGARNDGMAATTGRFIAFLDDDDELLADSLKIRVEEMSRDQNLALLYCAGYSLIYPYPFKMYRYYHFDKKKHTDKVLMMSCSSMMINREIFEQNDLYFDEQQSRMDDYDLCRRLLEQGLKVKSIPQPLVQINMHPDTRISSHQLVNYDFKDALAKRWGNSIDSWVYSYAEGVYLWRKCFGIAEHSYSETVKLLQKDFNRKPSRSFKIKYFILSIHPLLYLSLYHLSISIFQVYQNRAAKR